MFIPGLSPSPLSLFQLSSVKRSLLVFLLPFYHPVSLQVRHRERDPQIISRVPKNPNISLFGELVGNFKNLISFSVAPADIAERICLGNFLIPNFNQSWRTFGNIAGFSAQLAELTEH